MEGYTPLIFYLSVIFSINSTVSMESFISSFEQCSLDSKTIRFNAFQTTTLETCARMCVYSLHLTCTSFVYDCGHGRCANDILGGCYFMNDLIKSHDSLSIETSYSMKKYRYNKRTWACVGEHLMVPSQQMISIVVSPYFPQITRTRWSCTVTTIARPGYHIQLTFHTLIGSEQNCVGNTSIIHILYDFNNRSSSDWESMCPTRVPYILRTPGKALTIALSNTSPIVFKATLKFVLPDDCILFRCENGGTCVSAGGMLFCYCPRHYTGKYCEVDTLFCTAKGCQNNSTCAKLSNNEIVCVCDNGFQGNTCGIRKSYICKDDICGHGVCKIQISERDDNNSTYESSVTSLQHDEDYFCECDPGYTGKYCDTKYSPCVSDPCHIGQCIDKNKTYICFCPTCNYGVCMTGDTGYSCMCFPGYTGTHCSVDIDECLPSPCGEHGKCIDYVNAYRCVCEPYYKGTNCEVCISPICSPTTISHSLYPVPLTTSSEGIPKTTQRRTRYIHSIITMPFPAAYTPPSNNSTTIQVPFSKSPIPFSYCLNDTDVDIFCTCKHVLCNASVPDVDFDLFCSNQCAIHLERTCADHLQYCILPSCLHWWISLMTALYTFCQNSNSDQYNSIKQNTSDVSENTMTDLQMDSFICVGGVHTHYTFSGYIGGVLNVKSHCGTSAENTNMTYGCVFNYLMFPLKAFNITGCTPRGIHICVHDDVNNTRFATGSNLVIHNISDISVTSVLNSSSSDTISNYKVQLCIAKLSGSDIFCVLGFVTIRCSSNISHSECSNNQCAHGYCVESYLVPGYMCECYDGYSGKLCSIPQNTTSPASESDKIDIFAMVLYIVVGLFCLQTAATASIYFRRHHNKTKGEATFDETRHSENDLFHPSYLHTHVTYSDDEDDLPFSLTYAYTPSYQIRSQTILGVEVGKSEA